MSFKSFIASTFLGNEIAKLEAAFTTIESKVATVVTAEATKIKGDVIVEIAHAKTVFAALEGKAKAEVTKAEADALAVEAKVKAEAAGLEAKVKAELAKLGF